MDSVQLFDLHSSTSGCLPSIIIAKIHFNNWLGNEKFNVIAIDRLSSYSAVIVVYQSGLNDQESVESHNYYCIPVPLHKKVAST